MNEPTTLWLIRHAQPDGVEGRCYGRYDAALSLEGTQQAQEIAKRMAGEPLAQVYSSTLRRALETARIVAEPHGLNVEALEELAEIHFGDFEGLTFEDIERRYPAMFQSWMEAPTEMKFPNGEGFVELRQRALRALGLLLDRHRGDTFAIVSHSGVIRLIIAEILSVPDREIFRLAQRPAAINRISYFDHGPMVELING